ncbi:hypothetical protein Droror1_Dr00009581 [Drosera rotundifolia]
MKITNVTEYQEIVKQKLAKMIYDYYASGAEDQWTLAENRNDYYAVLEPHIDHLDKQQADPVEGNHLNLRFNNSLHAWCFLTEAQTRKPPKRLVHRRRHQRNPKHSIIDLGFREMKMGKGEEARREEEMEEKGGLVGGREEARRGEGEEEKEKLAREKEKAEVNGLGDVERCGALDLDRSKG